jgi:VIT1/CCC1 family predicted Fe2+/Mn2+ transporter
MLSLLLQLVIAAIVLGLVWWLVAQIPPMAPFAHIIQVVCIVIFVIYVIYILMGLVGVHTPALR